MTLGTKAISLEGAIVNVIINILFTLRPFEIFQYAYITIDTGKAAGCCSLSHYILVQLGK
jgi:hypothetical protein